MRTVIGIASLAWLAAAPAAWGNPCIDGAVAEYRDCKADCREALQVAKDACLNRDHACVEACRAGREDCVTATGFAADLDACAAKRDADVANCRALYPAGDTRDQCIDNVQVDAFRCRDQAREDNADELAACRAGFKGCARDCPPADPTDPPIDRPTCRRSAKREYRARQATCREDFQVTKDACRNRDHACVETCREDRSACRRPILDQLEADIAADCNGPRDAAIAQCEASFPPDSTALDECIDQAQVVAFQCRDAKREAARPLLELCRTGFRSCVLACPPPS